MDLAGGAVFEGDAAAEGRGRLGAPKNGKGGFLNRQGSRVRGFGGGWFRAVSEPPIVIRQI